MPIFSTEIDTVAVVKLAKLRYVSDDMPGIRRERKTDGSFEYTDQRGITIVDNVTLARIKSLAIPPAYSDVWICPIENGHLQATGRDERGRKQYRYHPRWRSVRDETKFHRMIEFGEALPRIRQTVTHDLAKPGLPREKVLAALVRLLETTLIRVGNEEYAKSNRSFGLTTLQVNHVGVEGTSLHFAFRGKSGKFHKINLRDRWLARIVARCKELPGKEVFQYLDEHTHEPHSIHSEDVNAYIHDIAGDEFSAKDFRTWAGTVIATLALCKCDLCDTLNKTQIKHNIVEAVNRASEMLGNTPAVCRKSYIHPDVLLAYEEGKLRDMMGEIREGDQADGGLSNEEAAVLRFLKGRRGTAVGYI